MKAASQTLASYVHEVYFLDDHRFDQFAPELYASALEKLCRTLNPDALLLGGSLDSLDIASRLASGLGADVITDCVRVDVGAGSRDMLCTKPVYNGAILATFKLNKKPCVLTIRPKAAESPEPNFEAGKIVPFDADENEPVVKVTLIEKIEEEHVDISEAKAIVSAGRGVKDSEGIDTLIDLIRTLRQFFSIVELGGTRPLVDSKLIPSSRQVGLTGKKVAPEIYIAVGISGSMQHVSGITGANKIIAINSSPDAYIFKVADYGVVAEYEEVVPAFRKKLEGWI
jgi:electron transfer flavoprotein alpha subunit